MHEEIIISKYLVKNYNLKNLSESFPMANTELLRVYKMGNARVRKSLIDNICSDCIDVFGIEISETIYNVVKTYINSLFVEDD